MRRHTNIQDIVLGEVYIIFYERINFLRYLMANFKSIKLIQNLCYFIFSCLRMALI